MTPIREAQKFNRLWKQLGVRITTYVPLPAGAGACRTPPLTGTEAEIVETLLSQTTGYEPRRSEA